MAVQYLGVLDEQLSTQVGVFTPADRGFLWYADRIFPTGRLIISHAIQHIGTGYDRAVVLNNPPFLGASGTGDYEAVAWGTTNGDNPELWGNTAGDRLIRSSAGASNPDSGHCITVQFSGTKKVNVSLPPVDTDAISFADYPVTLNLGNMPLPPVASYLEVLEVFTTSVIVGTRPATVCEITQPAGFVEIGTWSRSVVYLGATYSYTAGLYYRISNSPGPSNVLIERVSGPPGVTVASKMVHYAIRSAGDGDADDDTDDFTGDNPSNLHFGPGGQYYGVAYVADNDGYFTRADNPMPPFDVATVVVSSSAVGVVSDPRVYQGRFSRLHYVFSCDAGAGGSIRECVSDDDGASWNAPVTVFSSGTRPVVAVDPNTGTVLYACLSGSNIIGKLLNPGDTTLGAQFTFKDENGSNLNVQDTSFDISPAYDGTRRWLLTFRRSNAIQSYYSTDDGQTWTEIA